MKNRAGYPGNYEENVQTVNSFFREMEYQLGDGFSVNTGFFTIHPHIGGVFHSDKDVHNHAKHPISFRFQTLKPMRDLRDSIEVIIEGIADAQSWINEFIDLEENAVNTLFVPGNMFSITGHKIKIAGDDPGCGVYFVPADDPSKAVKVTRLGENTASHISGIAPKTCCRYHKIEVRTQFTGSGGVTLKGLRTITSDFTLEQV
jgi:hypothetical protein